MAADRPPHRIADLVVLALDVIGLLCRLFVLAAFSPLCILIRRAARVAPTVVRPWTDCLWLCLDKTSSVVSYL